MKEKMKEYLKAAISEVLEIMFFEPVKFSAASDSLSEWFQDVRWFEMTRLPFSGPHSGAFYLMAPESVLAGFAKNLLGLNEGEVSDQQKQDAFKEALNMIAGKTLFLFDQLGRYQLGLPEIAPGREVSGLSKKLEEQIVLFQTQESEVAVGFTIDGDAE
jgi:hypothetical protein